MERFCPEYNRYIRLPFVGAFSMELKHFLILQMIECASKVPPMDFNLIEFKRQKFPNKLTFNSQSNIV